MAMEPPTQGRWTTGLCACFEDCSSCCCAYCCPCVVVGRLVEIIDEGHTSCYNAAMRFFWLQCCTGCCNQLAIIGWCGCGFIYTCGYRARLRGKYNLPEGGCNDCCTDACCLCCSIAQQYRELQYRGIDPATGYFANREVYQQSSKKMARQQSAPSAQVNIVYQQAAPAPQRMPSRQSAPAPQRMVYQQAAPAPQRMPYQQAAPAPQRMPYQQVAPAPQRMPYQQAAPAPQTMPYHQATPGVPQRMPYQQSAPAPQRMPYQQSARAPQMLLEY